jgi:L-lactate dehydrogenase complex protein LldF
MPDVSLDLNDDPAELAGASRTYLRRKFMSAKVAISGANFMIAETGTLVVVESEGNGRMCLTMPQTLISVVGIEKILPTFADLEVFLQLLPRSSTAERMNPYTTMWTGVHPGDGPQKVHVVLLDNGRTRALADPLGRQALRCIRCSACLNSCPVYERVGGVAYGSVYPGPIGAILNPLLNGVDNGPVERSLPYASSLCGRCFEVCPVRIDIPEILVHLRGRVIEETHRAKHPPLPRMVGPEEMGMRAAGWFLQKPGRLALAQRGMGIFARVMGKRSTIGPLPIPGPALRWTGARDVDMPPRESFRLWWKRNRANGQSEQEGSR